MLPDKITMCHRTGFAKTCFQCVTEHGCRLWKRVSLIDRHPETGVEIAKDSYDCLDSQVELYYKDMLRRQLQTTATVDAMRKEVREGNDHAMIGTLARINHRMDALSIGAGDSQKLLDGPSEKSAS